MQAAMRASHYFFHLGDFKCNSLCDGGMDYKIESLVANAPHSEVAEALKIPDTEMMFITTPYDTGGHGCRQLSAHNWQAFTQYA
jgi:hypothetical protein